MSPAKPMSVQKSKLSERDHNTLHGIVRKDFKTTVLKIISELNEHLQNPAFIKTACREFKIKNLCFHRQMFQRVQSGVWPIGISLLSCGKELFYPNRLQPIVKYWRGFWGTITQKSEGPMISIHVRIKIRDYLQILSDQVHPMA